MIQFTVKKIAAVTVLISSLLIACSFMFSSPDKLASYFQELHEKLALIQKTESQEKIYLHIDRKFVEPGEQFWFRAYVRDANTLKPAEKSEVLYTELLNPQGSVINSKRLIARNGKAMGDFLIDPNLPGGNYKLKAYTTWSKNQNVIFERDITVHKAVLPNLNMRLDFAREAYGKGDRVVVKMELTELSNEPLANMDFNYKVSIAGNEIGTYSTKSDENGKAQLKFKLPAELETTDGLVNVLIPYKGTTESISRSIPIVLNNIDLQFLPEGGDWVKRIPARIAFKAINEFGKPADVEGYVQDEEGVRVANFSTTKFGLGSFDLTASSDVYTAVITKPSGVTDLYELPAPLENGYTLRVDKRSNSQAQLTISTPGSEKVLITARNNGKLYASQEFYAKQGKNTLIISTTGIPTGICEFSIFDQNHLARAERLYWVNYGGSISATVETDKDAYAPREKVKAKINIKDNRGVPVPGTFSMAVVDDNALAFADDKQGEIIAQLLLQSELKGEIFEPNFYFNPEKPKAKKALDLLLMTHGWRRYSMDEVANYEARTINVQPELAKLSGVIKDITGNPLGGARIKVGKHRVLSNKKGEYTLSNVDLYEAKLMEVSATGYFGKSKNITAYSNGLNFNLAPEKFLGTNNASGRPNSIQGNVFDRNTGEKVLYGTVRLRDNTGRVVAGTQTDLEGNFKFNNVNVDKGTIEVSYVGYETQQIQNIVANQARGSNVTMAIDQSNVSLNSVVVTGMGKKRVRRQTQAMHRVAAETLTATSTRKQRKRAKRAQRKAKEDRAMAAPPPAIPAPAEPVMEEVAEAEAPIFDVAMDDMAIAKDEMERNELRNAGVNHIIDNNVIGQLKNADEKAFVVDGVRMRGGAAKKPHVQTTVYYKPKSFYAPKYTAKEQEVENRTDFRKTLHFEPFIKVGRNGRASVSWHNSDEITSYRITLEGITSTGGVVHTTKKYHTQKPLEMLVKMPSQLVSGDQLSIPVTLTNTTASAIDGEITFAGPDYLKAIDGSHHKLSLPSGKSKTVQFEFNVTGQKVAEDDFTISFEGDGYTDAITKQIKTAPRGFPVLKTISGSQTDQKFEVIIDDAVENSLTVTLQAHPNTVSDVLSGMDRMLRQPSGCFEQTASSNYPNILVMDYLRESGQQTQAIKTRAEQLLDSGYKQLKRYEIKGGGFDVWGRGPAHEGLTAYGLIQFHDMKSVYNVEQDLINRTAKFLYTRRLGNGGWDHKNRNGHGFVSEEAIGDAYIVYAMSEVNYSGNYKREFEKSYQDALDSEDPYLMGLMANALINRRDARGKTLLANALKVQAKDGSWTGKKFSITHSTGKGLAIETTALMAMALMKQKMANGELQKAMNFISSSKTGYGFGSTQSTVMAMRSLAQFAKYSKRTKEDGHLVLTVNGKQVEKYFIAADTKETIKLDGLSKHFKAGVNEVRVQFKGMKEGLPHELEVQYATRQPKNDEECKLELTTAMNSDEIGVGETVRFEASITNTAAEAVHYPMMILGIPAGLSVQHWQLKELTEKAKADYYEMFDGNVVFHFLKMMPDEKRVIELDLKAEVQGTYEAPASQAFLYYTNEHRVWNKPAQVKVKE